MKNLWIVAILAVVALALGCGPTKEGEPGKDDNGGGGAAEGGTSGTSTPTSGGGPEATVEAMLDGFKEGDVDAFLNGIDLKGLYDLSLTDEEKEEISYEDFVGQMREGMQGAPTPDEGFAYKIGKSRKEGDTVILSVSIRQDADSEWEESEVPFKKIGGEWKITAEGFMDMMSGE